MLDCTLFGLNPAGHHAINLALHITNTILLFLVLLKMTKSRWQSAFVAALFAVHPLHVESVAWAAERKDVLCTLFWILCTMAYVLYVDHPNRRRYLLVAGVFALALMTKPMAVTLPFVLLLLDFWPLRRLQRGFARLVLEKVPLFVLSVASSIVTIIAQSRGMSLRPLELIPIGVRIENALVSYVTYILKMVWPRNLAVLYPHPLQLLPVWQVLGAFVLLAGITFVVVRERDRRPYLIAGWLWYIITLIPMIGLVQVGYQALADRYTYVPLLGVFIMIAWGISDLPRKREREKGRNGDPQFPNTHPQTPYTPGLPLVVASIVVVVVLASCTHTQIGYWHDDLSLFGRAVECTKNNYLMHNLFGLALEDAGQVEEAMGQYNEALRIWPDYVAARLNLGIELAERLNRPKEAIQQFQIAIKADPDNADSYYNLGVVLYQINDVRGAAAQFEKAIQLKPNDIKTQTNLGQVLLASGRTDEAIRHFQSALQIDASSIDARLSLAEALSNKHDIAGAVLEYREVIRMKPDCGAAHSSLATLLFTQGDYAGAWSEVHLAQKYGSPPESGFLTALSQKMPDPGT
jgi:tetratricopeptide (TPR) repeat protein